MNRLLFGIRKQDEANPQSKAAADSRIVIERQYKILIVDDDAVIIKTTSAKLRSHGYQVVSAMDAAEAMQTARQTRPDLMLLDISFPPDGGNDWDGFKIMAWFQRVDKTRGIPVIVITGGEPEKYEALSLERGAVSFFNKPINHDELLTVIAQQVRRKRDQAAPVRQ
jgi:CheY-like chemotaxis protein